MNTDEITEKIIGCAYIIANELGHGFLKTLLLMKSGKQG